MIHQAEIHVNVIDQVHRDMMINTSMMTVLNEREPKGE